MSIQRFENGPRMSRVVVHNDTVYLAGLTADTSVGKSVGEQTSEILAKIDGLLKMLEPYGIKELVQSGVVAVARGPRSITDRPMK